MLYALDGGSLKLHFIFFKQASGGEDLRIIRCVYPECDMVVKTTNELIEHLENECLYRLEICGLCHEGVNLNAMKVRFLVNGMCLVVLVKRLSAAPYQGYKLHLDNGYVLFLHTVNSRSTLDSLVSPCVSDFISPDNELNIIQ